jgi:hypothetical protein
VTFLLDVNVLISLIDPAHVHHEAAHDWFARGGARAWASCPLTENAVLRILGSPKYPGGPGTPAMAAPSLASLRGLPGHSFWADDISLLDRDLVDPERILSTGQVTDTYLLALACANAGRLATFDRRLVTVAVLGGAEALRLIG